MGDADMNRGTTLPGLGRVRRGATWGPGTAVRFGWVLLCLAMLVPGCRSGGPPPQPATPTPPATGADAEAQAGTSADESAPDAIRVTGLTVREGAPGVRVEVSADEPLVWTSFRDLEGRVVIELPNAILGEDVQEIAEPQGVLESIELGEEPSGRRPLARLVVATREEVEHNVRAEGTRLILELDPLEPAQAGRPALAFEPIPEEEPEVAAADEAPAPPAPTTPPQPEPARPEAAAPSLAEAPGTPEDPRRGPSPTGAPASRLSGVAVDAAGDTLVVEIRGDGQFAYSTFHLTDPERFVVDLDGVVNRADRSVVPVDSGPLARVRVAQFRPFPEPVSRVVLDLANRRFPEIERTPDSLVLRFREEQRAASPARPEPPAPAAPRQAAADDAPVQPAPAAMEPGDSAVVQVPAAGDEPAPSEPRPEQATEPPPMTAPSPSGPDRVAERGPASTPVPQAATEREAEARQTTPEPGPAPRTEPGLEELSDASLFDATEIEVDRPESEGEGDDLFFGTRQVGGDREYFGEPIDMSLKDADVVETLRSFAEISGLNIVVQPEVSGRVTVELHDVPWDQALEQILKINNLGYEVEGNIMRIAPLQMLRQEAQEQQQLAAAQALSIPLETVMKRLSYTSARNIASILQRGGAGGILSQRASVIVDDRTNTLIISELPEYMDTVLSIINNLDEPEPQVMIEARIIETTKRFSRELGISWGFDLTAGPATGNSTGIEFPNNLDAGGSVNLGTAGQNALLNLRFGNVLNTFQLDAVLNAAEEDGLVNILSTPKVATLNNHQATIQSGLQVPIQTVANNTVTVQFVNATLELQVTPQITADGTVLMDIAIQKREVQTAFLVPGATNAPIATKEAATQVMVRDGGTAVIGGIYEVSTDQAENRVPGLSNIPILGHLFRNRSRTDENEELLIFITPRVIRI